MKDKQPCMGLKERSQEQEGDGGEKKRETARERRRSAAHCMVFIVSYLLYGTGDNGEAGTLTPELTSARLVADISRI